jgi:CheY-like chemotaxis protein
MCRNSLLKGKTQQENMSKFKYIPCLKTKIIDTQVKKKVKFDSIVKIREDLKNLTKKTFQLQGTSKFFPDKEGFSHDEKENKLIIDFNHNKDENFYGDVENSGNFMLATKFKAKCKATNSVLESSPNRSFDMNDLNVKKIVFKVLVVDDEITQRQALQRQLKSLNLSKDVIFDIILASDGVEAIYRIMSEINENGYVNPIRCVIIDENMKYLNGSKTLELIRQINFLKDYIKNAYIISLSSHYSPEFEQYVKKCGCNLSVSKPIEKSFLTEIMNNLINEIE